MTYPYETQQSPSARERWRQREARRRLYARRRAVALLILLALVAALFFGGRALIAWWQGRQDGPEGGPTPSTSTALPFTPAKVLPGPDLDGDGVAEQVVISAPEGGLLKAALVTGPTGKEQVIGQVVYLPDAPVEIKDLPRERQLLVSLGELIRRGEPVKVQVGGEEALEARGGEPNRKAWRLDRTQGLVSVDYYAAAAPVTPPEPTMILIDKGLNVLWYYQEGRLIQTARVTTGQHVMGPAPTHANRMENRITPEGRFTVSLLSEGMPYYQANIPAGDPKNPLGTRWIGFNAYQGDNGTIWAIHGTNEPEMLGMWASDGCIRMRNDEIERLYAHMAIGTPILIQDALAKIGQ